MKHYDYNKAILDDVRAYLDEEYTTTELKAKANESFDDLYNELIDKLWIEDSVTGNAIGSYTLNRWEAEENLGHNLHLLAEACREFGYDNVPLGKGAEWCDVTIRCYLLGSALYVALREFTA